MQNWKLNSLYIYSNKTRILGHKVSVFFCYAGRTLGIIITVTSLSILNAWIGEALYKGATDQIYSLILAELLLI